jgi:hypothetical protein
VRRAALLLALLFAGAGALILALRETQTPADRTVVRPIIAQLFASPEAFAGKKVEVYGLVIESDAKTEFLLQDVSQRPLRVLGNASVGDQVTVLGTVQTDAMTIYLSAESLKSTKVLGGGGCC